MSVEVINKSNNKRYKVYDISYDKAGYPHFLVYKNGQWLRMSAKHFRPYTYNDLENKIGGCWLRADNVKSGTVGEDGSIVI